MFGKREAQCHANQAFCYSLCIFNSQCIFNTLYFNTLYIFNTLSYFQYSVFSTLFLCFQCCLYFQYSLCIFKQDSYSRVVEYYGENARSISPANFFAQIVRFVNAFKVSPSFWILLNLLKSGSVFSSGSCSVF